MRRFSPDLPLQIAPFLVQSSLHQKKTRIKSQIPREDAPLTTRATSKLTTFTIHPPTIHQPKTPKRNSPGKISTSIPCQLFSRPRNLRLPTGTPQ
jgi:hypothetical protein